MKSPALRSSDLLRLSQTAAAIGRADTLLRELAEPHDCKPTPASQAASEASEAPRTGLNDAFVPAAWSAILEFGTAAVAHTRGLAGVIDRGNLVSAPAIARAALEHAQRAAGLLEATHEGAGTVDDRVTARQRAARARLEEIFSARQARDTLEKLVKDPQADAEAPARKESRC